MRTFPIIEKLGGRSAWAERRGVTVHVIRMWTQRGRIPGDELVALIEACERDQIAYDADDLRVIEIETAE